MTTEEWALAAAVFFSGLAAGLFNYAWSLGMGIGPIVPPCRRRDSNPRHADYDDAAGVAGLCGCSGFSLVGSQIIESAHTAFF